MSTEETPTLNDIIKETMDIQDPEPDNLEVPEELDIEDDDDILKSLLDAEDDDDDEDEGEVSDDSDERLNETFEVKVDGEIVEVSLKEALAGYQRQADYTRKAQALAAEKEELQAQIEEFNDVIGTVENLETAWEENPVYVLTHFAANTENPTQSVALLIKELASQNLLDQEFMDIFGITPEIRKAWEKDGEVANLRRKVNMSESEKQKLLEEEQYEQEVRSAIAEYDRQIDEILAEEGAGKLTDKQRTAFRQKLASYAYDNELTNLKAAYKALKYEESQKKAKAAKKAKERATVKKNTPAVGRSSASATGAAPVTDTSDLSALIRASMDEVSSRK